ncbi:MAG: hypothetical protein Q8L86_07550 [Vicinamibacterales bacterium]|nr:hypothetical protein [Vicinamibacterales bacterium]
MRPVAIGVVVGLPGALVLSRVLQSLLFEVAAIELTAYAGAAATLTLAALAATIIPTRRLLHLSPVAALRGE